MSENLDIFNENQVDLTASEPFNLFRKKRQSANLEIRWPILVDDDRRRISVDARTKVKKVSENSKSRNERRGLHPVF